MPAGLKTARASPVQSPVGALKTRWGLPVVRSQRVIVSARVTVASCLPPGCQATELTILSSACSLFVLQHGGLPAGGHVPDPHRAVPGRGGHLRAVGAEGHVVDEALVTAQDAVPLRQLHVPDARLAIGRDATPEASRARRTPRHGPPPCGRAARRSNSPEFASQSRNV